MVIATTGQLHDVQYIEIINEAEAAETDFDWWLAVCVDDDAAAAVHIACSRPTVISAISRMSSSCVLPSNVIDEPSTCLRSTCAFFKRRLY